MGELGHQTAGGLQETSIDPRVIDDVVNFDVNEIHFGKIGIGITFFTDLHGSFEHIPRVTEQEDLSEPAMIQQRQDRSIFGFTGRSGDSERRIRISLADKTY